MIGISFILPFYKLERWMLDRAVDSILLARLACDYEIIVVDDGTPGGEARQWLKGKSDRIKYVWQENGGPGGARNTGIDIATKEYIQFLDPDDYFFSAGLRQLVALIDKEHPDVVVCSNYKIVHDQQMLSPKSVRLKTKTYGSGLEYMTHRNIFAVVWGFAFRREALGGQRFLPGIYHEDEEFIPRLFARVGKMVETNILAYAYCQRPTSIVHNPDARHIEKRFDDMFLVLSRLQDWAESADSGIGRKAFERRKEQFALSVIYHALRLLPDEKLRQCLSRLAGYGCWPLPPASYTPRYRLFRRLTDRWWKLKIMRLLLKRR